MKILEHIEPVGAVFAVIICWAALATFLDNLPNATAGNVAQVHSSAIDGFVPVILQNGDTSRLGILLPQDRTEGARSAILSVRGTLEPGDIALAMGTAAVIAAEDVLIAQRWVAISPLDVRNAFDVQIERLAELGRPFTDQLADIHPGLIAFGLALAILILWRSVLWMCGGAALMAMASSGALAILTLGWTAPLMGLTPSTGLAAILCGAGLALVLIILCLGLPDTPTTRRLPGAMVAALGAVVAVIWFEVPMYQAAIGGTLVLLVPQSVAALLAAGVVRAGLELDQTAMIVLAVVFLAMMLLPRRAGQGRAVPAAAEDTPAAGRTVITSGFPRRAKRPGKGVGHVG